MSAKASDIARRKAGHIRAALNEDVEFQARRTGFERYAFDHQALPEMSRDDVDTSTALFGHTLSFPLVISPLTGGTDEAAEYNRRLAHAAQRFGIGMGVGSQRAALENPALASTFKVRDIAPDVLLFANLGAVQLNYGYGADECALIMEMIGADALMLHLNPLQECVQAGGNTDFHDLAARIAEVCESLDAPVVVKEVGHGISERTAKLLVDAGVAGIDVAGAGGTSWARMESCSGSDPKLSSLGTSMGEWGIPTVDSLLGMKRVAPHTVTIASGGVRSGQDIAKSIALGADVAGMALPLLKWAAQSQDVLIEHLEEIKEELATVMFCTGCRSIDELRRVSLMKVVPTGRV